MTRGKILHKTDELVDELLEGCESPEDIFGKHGLVTRLTKRLVERALRAELTDHLGDTSHAPEGRGSGNARNGSSGKTVQTAYGWTATNTTAGSTLLSECDFAQTQRIGDH